MAARRGQKEEEGYNYKENPYLTPGQELLEASAMANPFLGRSSGFGPLSQRSLEAEGAYEEQASKLPNAILAPPQGLSSLPLEKQMAWRENLAKEAQLDAQLLQSESHRRKEELENISRKEGLELIKRSADLNPTKPEYPAQKAALIRQFPGGANSEEAKAIFSDLDSRRKVVESAELEEKKAREGAERTRGENNFTVARTEASNLGPEFLGNFLEISKAQGPDAAIAYVGREGARAKEAGLRTQLQGQGMTPEEITTTYGGEQIPFRTTPFQFPAAEEAAKGKNIAELRRQARQERTDLMRIRAQAYAQAGKPEDAKDYGWGPVEDQMLAEANERYNNLSGRGVGQPSAVPTQPAVTQPVTAQPAIQARPKTPEAPVYTKKKRNPNTGKMVGLNARTNTWEAVP